MPIAVMASARLRVGDVELVRVLFEVAVSDRARFVDGNLNAALELVCERLRELADKLLSVIGGKLLREVQLNLTGHDGVAALVCLLVRVPESGLCVGPLLLTAGSALFSHALEVVMGTFGHDDFAALDPALTAEVEHLPRAFINDADASTIGSRSRRGLALGPRSASLVGAPPLLNIHAETTST